jgi:hypothetical protein
MSMVSDVLTGFHQLLKSSPGPISLAEQQNWRIYEEEKQGIAERIKVIEKGIASLWEDVEGIQKCISEQRLV